VGEVQTFWTVLGERARLELRRYASSGKGACPGPHGYHDGRAAIGEQYLLRSGEGYVQPGPDVRHDDPRWPTGCEHCPYVFDDDDHWQSNQREQIVRPDTGETVAWGLGAVPPGAMWDAWWLPEGWTVDGISLVVQLPDGTGWTVDGPVANHDGPHDTRTGHRCWTRTGDPRAVPPTVSATPSIVTPGYHGFLTDGVLRSV